MTYSLFSGINSGLTSAYSIIAQTYGTNVTKSTIASALSNSNLTSSLNPTFASYLNTNFSSLDTNRDGVLSAAELSNTTNKINSLGVTSSELAQLGSASGLSSDMLSQVIEHFNQIDKNHDGRVTSAEISAFKLESAEAKKKTEFSNKAAANLSTFYGSDDSSTADSSSMVDFMYMNTGSSTGSNS